MEKELEQCHICPRNCGVNRKEGKLGNCKCNANVKIALASLHYFEEPCISGTRGSGTVFFTGCNLHCCYCQNYEISQEGKGKEITVEHLAQIFLNQQNKGAENINLVTPTMYVYAIKQAITIARQKGLIIPIVYNTNGYETVETIQQLKGYIDIYLPDFKYAFSSLAQEYSKTPDYVEIAKKAIMEMYKQVGKPVIDEKGMLTKGIVIRHLILPNHITNTKHVLKWIKETFQDNVYVSIMAQYFPTYLAKQDPKLSRKLTRKEYQQVERYINTLNFKNGYMQELGEHEEEYVPKFDLSE